MLPTTRPSANTTKPKQSVIISTFQYFHWLIDRFNISLFSVLQQTHCAFVAYDSNYSEFWISTVSHVLVPISIPQALNDYGNLLKWLATTITETYLIPWAPTGSCVQLESKERIWRGEMKMNGPERQKLRQRRYPWQCEKKKCRWLDREGRN